MICCFTFLAKAELGIASFYSDAFHGRATSSGEIYNKNKFTGAHKTLPYGTLVKVTRLDTGVSITVKINDRGPYVKGHVIWVSNTAAEKLDLVEIEEAKVKLEVVGQEKAKEKTPKKELAFKAPEDEFTAKGVLPVKESPSVKPKEEAKPVVKIPSLSPVKKKSQAKTPKNVPKSYYSNLAKASKKLATIKTKGFKKFDLYKTAAKKNPKELGFGMQVGNYTDFDNVLSQVAMLQENWFSEVYLIVEEKEEKTNYKIILESFEDRASATHYAKDVKRKKLKGYVVDLNEFDKSDVYAFQAIRPKKEGFALQLSLLTSYEGVLDKVDELQKKWFNNILLEVSEGESGKTNYKIMLGPFPDMDTAASVKKGLKKKGLKSFTVDLSTK